MEFRFVSKDEEKNVDEFLKAFDLKLEDDVEETLVCVEDGEIIATCSYFKNIIKCFAVKEERQGQGIASILITKIQNRMFEKGIYDYFVFTPSYNEIIFKSLGYKTVASACNVLLLEGGLASIEKYLQQMFKKSGLVKDKKRAALVVNCNPFTLGHRYLIEKAAIENDEVVVFVVEEDKSIFPTDVRFELVKKGCEDLKNVIVLKGGRYIISSNTFPTYFLKSKDDKLEIYTRLDATIFAMRIAKVFNINRRYVGTEPYCEVTNEYNKALLDVLPKFSIEVKLVDRFIKDGRIISASLVRSLLRQDMIDEVKNIVPSTTYEFLISDGGSRIIDKIKGEK